VSAADTCAVAVEEVGELVESLFVSRTKLNSTISTILPWSSLRCSVDNAGALDAVEMCSTSVVRESRSSVWFCKPDGRCAVVFALLS
jgi:hypothetical protein